MSENLAAPSSSAGYSLRWVGGDQLTLEQPWNRRQAPFRLIGVPFALGGAAALGAALTGDIGLKGLVLGAVFLGVGASQTLIALAYLLNRTTLSVAHGGLSVRHRPVPWPAWSARRADIKQLYVEEDPEAAHVRFGAETLSAPVYRLRVLMVDGGRHTLVRAIPDVEEAQGLEAKLEGALGVRDRRVFGEMPKR